jgi:hypothetical protein
MFFSQRQGFHDGSGLCDVFRVQQEDRSAAVFARVPPQWAQSGLWQIAAEAANAPWIAIEYRRELCGAQGATIILDSLGA